MIRTVEIVTQLRSYQHANNIRREVRDMAACAADEIERLRKNNAFLEELFAMALDRRYSSELIGIMVRNYLSTIEQAKDGNP